jgi:hypothetical protein
MTIEVQNILSNFDSLPDAEKRELASEILRRTVSWQSEPLSDDQLTSMAEELFLSLDCAEGQNG